MTGINQRGRYGSYIQLILTFVDFIILNIAFFVTAGLSPEFIAERARTIWLLANVCYLPAAYFMRHTQTARTIGMENVVANSIYAVLIHAPLFIVGLYFQQIDNIVWRIFAEFYGIMFALLPLWWIISRKLIKYYRRRGRNFRRVVIVGSNPTSNKLYSEISSYVGIGYRIMGFFDEDKHPDTPDDLFRGSIEHLDEYVDEQNIDEIFCALPGTRYEDINRTMQIAESNVAQYYYVPQFSRYAQRNYDMFAIGNIPVLSIRHQPLVSFRNRLIKRLFDILFSSIVLLFSPFVFLPIAIAIKISSPGPIFFKQKRTGYRGREFTCYKFRTMRMNTSADTLQASKNDPRKTKVGDFLRRTSLDELPQFINVFLGNMSVVGPRPHMLKHTEEYRRLINKYMVRLYVKPGISGWAQVHGYRGQTEELWQMEKRVEHDVWYIEHWSIFLDLRIIVMTLLNAFKGEKNAF